MSGRLRFDRWAMALLVLAALGGTGWRWLEAHPQHNPWTPLGAWEHPDGDLPTLIHSIHERLFPLGDDVAFVPGHGGSSTFGRERRENPFVGDAAYERWQLRFPSAAT